ncbi:hypothetical protein BD309DRAFT_739285 [Dichomitus squalens]|nr:hypothetical protein BD309DRAFT_739285 [Dichomitus squalens]
MRSPPSRFKHQPTVNTEHTIRIQHRNQYPCPSSTSTRNTIIYHLVYTQSPLSPLIIDPARIPNPALSQLPCPPSLPAHAIPSVHTYPSRRIYPPSQISRSSRVRTPKHLN